MDLVCPAKGSASGSLVLRVVTLTSDGTFQRDRGPVRKNQLTGTSLLMREYEFSQRVRFMLT